MNAAHNATCLSDCLQFLATASGLEPLMVLPSEACIHGSAESPEPEWPGPEIRSIPRMRHIRLGRV
jgi:hypothetical protein